MARLVERAATFGDLPAPLQRIVRQAETAHRSIHAAAAGTLAHKAWNSLLHPRDRHGRFLEVGSKVDVDGHGPGEVVGTVGNSADQVQVRLPDGTTRKVRTQQVVKRASPPAAVPGPAARTVPRPGPAAPAPVPAAPALTVPAGMHVPTAAEREALKIPPAWVDVVVADDPAARVVARGRDGKGRGQARYSTAHSDAQAEAKFARIKAFAPLVPELDRALAGDSLDDDTAAAVLVMRRLGIRVGSTADTQAKQQAYGATTLQARHVTVTGGVTRFDFVGKKGVRIQLESHDPAVARAVGPRLAGKQPGDRLFDTTDGKTGGYVKAHTGPAFKNHDLRTYLANAIAAREVAADPSLPGSAREAAARRNAVGDVVSAQLGNNRSEALKSYIDPAVFAPWHADDSATGPQRSSTELQRSSTGPQPSSTG